MNLEKAQEIIKSASGLYQGNPSDYDYGEARGFVEGYEAGKNALMQICEELEEIHEILGITRHSLELTGITAVDKIKDLLKATNPKP